MKQYIEPKIKAVELDAEQSILQFCRAGGIYLFNKTTANIWCGTRTGANANCMYTPKGGSGGSTGMDSDSTYFDSSQALPS